MSEWDDFNTRLDAAKNLLSLDKVRAELGLAVALIDSTDDNPTGWAGLWAGKRSPKLTNGVAYLDDVNALDHDLAAAAAHIYEQLADIKHLAAAELDKTTPGAVPPKQIGVLSRAIAAFGLAAEALAPTET